MTNAFLLSLRQMVDPQILGLLGKVLLTTLALLSVLGVASYYGLTWLLDTVLPRDGGFAAAATAALIAILLSIFLFRVVAMLVINIFSDEVVDAVEMKHYPERAETAKPPGYVMGLKMGLASAGRALGYNLLAAPIYIMLIVTAIGPAVAFFAVNALLIGRDLQDMVAARHPDHDQPNGQLTITKANRFGLGLITALLLAIPFVNFLAPILGAAMATHLVHLQRGESYVS